MTRMERPETEQIHGMAMNVLGNGLTAADQHEDALSVRGAELSMKQRLDVSEYSILIAQGNLASTYKELGRHEFLSLRQEVYSGAVKIFGEEHKETLFEAFNYANDFFYLRRLEEARSLLRKTIPKARHVLGESNELTLKMRLIYAQTLYGDEDATLSDLREAVETLEELAQIARRVLGGAHPITVGVETCLRRARAALRARETPPPPPKNAA